MLSRQKQNDLIECTCQQRAWARALADHWRIDPGERATIENLLIAGQVRIGKMSVFAKQSIPAGANFPKKEGQEPGKDQE